MTDPEKPEEKPNVVFDWAHLTELYDEGLHLVEEVADYLSTDGESDKKGLRPMALSVFMAESMRLTTRLTQMMSWLMLQRAVANGEITTEEARKPEHRLRKSPPRGDPRFADLGVLPDRLRDLIERSEVLAERVDRLEEEFHKGPDANAVQSMLQHLESEMQKPKK